MHIWTVIDFPGGIVGYRPKAANILQNAFWLYCLTRKPHLVGLETVGL